MPANLGTRAVRELNVLLVSAFNEGSSDAYAALRDQYGQQGTPIATPLDLVRRIPATTRETAILYPEVSFEIEDFGSGDGNPEEGIKLYESRILSGNYKGKVIPVPLVDFEDDLIGQFRVVFYKLGNALVRAPLRAVEKALYLAATGTTITSGIDGRPLFDTQHVQKPQEAYDAAYNPYVSNKVVQAAGMTFDNVSVLYSKFLAIPGEDGVPNEDNVPQWLWGDTDYAGTMTDVCYNDRPSQLAGGGNPWLGKLKPMWVRRLQGTGIWGIASSYDALDRAMNYVDREPLKLHGLFTNPSDPIVRERRQLKWQVDGRFAVAAGHYTKIMMSSKS